MSLSESDQLVIDSYSDRLLLEDIGIKQRNRRFQVLTKLFISTMSPHALKPPELAEEGVINEFD